PCMLPPGENCQWKHINAALGLETDILSNQMQPGCPCTFMKEKSDTHEWVTQHIAPDVLCYCSDTTDAIDRPIENRGDWPVFGMGYAGFMRGWGKGGAAKWLRPNPSGNGPGSMVVPPGYVFTMGDNRDNSHDGRYWGLVPISRIKGKALLIWFAWPDLWNRWFHKVHG
ncbi:MAG TPA: signal peptidase I, partial [Myxococcales bacterium]|nr:signal peptidase I [Myxococcales bacterium]